MGVKSRGGSSPLGRTIIKKSHSKTYEVYSLNNFKKILKILFIIIALIAIIIFFEKLSLNERAFLITIGVITYSTYEINKKIGELKDEFKKNKEYFYRFEKKIIDKNNDEPTAILSLKHRLPFTPILGMSISESKYPIYEEDSFEDHDSGYFYVDRITSIKWSNGQFICEIKPHKLSSKNDLGAVLAHHYYNEWELSATFSSIKAEKILEKYLNKIESEANKNKTKDTDFDRDILFIKKVRSKLNK